VTLAARGLRYGFRERVVGEGVDLTLAPGEIACVLGPNGSGKTTLLRTLLGLLPPLGGELTLDGKRLRDWPMRERATRIAYVPQASESYFDFTLRETVEMGRTAHRGVFAAASARDREHAARALERMGLAALAGRPIQRVSGGERQLALIARALATEAPHLLMDEPAASLDFGNQALILEELSALRGSGSAVLFSTHHPDHALRIADRAILIKGGRAMAAGPAVEVLNPENLSALYGRPIDVATVTSPDGTPRRVCVPLGAGHR
jgi:iron complex transport system ATP-binding protein